MEEILRGTSAPLPADDQVQRRGLSDDIMDAMVELKEREKVVLQLRFKRKMAARETGGQEAGDRSMPRRDSSFAHLHRFILSHI